MGIGGFFRKLTGTTAEVRLAIGSAHRGGKVAVKVEVKVGPEAISAKRVYLTLTCSEQVDIPNYGLPIEVGGTKPVGSSHNHIHVRANERLFEKEFTLAPGRDLAAASQHTFEGEIELPAHVPPSLSGKYTSISWHAQAGIDTSMMDPGSAWHEIRVA